MLVRKDPHDHPTQSRVALEVARVMPFHSVSCTLRAHAAHPVGLLHWT